MRNSQFTDAPFPHPVKLTCSLTFADFAARPASLYSLSNELAAECVSFALEGETE